MAIPFKENLIKILNDSVSFVKENYPDELPTLDHGSYQTSDKQVYEDVVANLKTTEKFLKEIIYSGRRLSLFELSEPIKVDEGFVLERIEVEEPKPESKVADSFWESVSYKVQDFEATLEKFKNTKKELKKVRQLGDQRWGYVELENYRIQFRNNFFGIEMMEDHTVNTSQGKSEDYKKMYEEEKEKRLMLLAEVDNEKKRYEKQRNDFVKLANISLMKDVFEIIDDLNRAVLNNADKDSLNMILNKLLGILNNYGVVPVDVKEGDSFDPNKMEAVSSIDGGTEKSKKVIHVDQMGFKLRDEDRVLRNARVIVGK